MSILIFSNRVKRVILNIDQQLHYQILVNSLPFLIKMLSGHDLAYDLVHGEQKTTTRQQRNSYCVPPFDFRARKGY